MFLLTWYIFWSGADCSEAGVVTADLVPVTVSIMDTGDSVHTVTGGRKGYGGTGAGADRLSGG